jgi:hypothetical protein
MRWTNWRRGAVPSRVVLPELVEPAYFHCPDYSSTLGDEAADVAALAGYAPDPEQRLALDAAFGLTARGRLAAFEVAIIASRQNLKTGFLKQAALAKIFLLKRQLLVWSAHEFSTTQEAFRDLCMLIESTPEFDRRVKQIYRGNGDEAIELLGGQRIKFRARTKSGGRGLSGEDVDLDEAFALLPDHMGALLPLLSTFEDPQVTFGSSAGLAKSEVLRAIRDRGRARRGKRLVYIEWCSPEGRCADPRCDHALAREGCSMDDPEMWRRANPALGRRITEDYIRSEREALPSREFGRERMGWWDEPDSDAAAFPPGAWAACATEVAEAPASAAIGVAVSVDRSSSSIGAASGDDTPHLGAVMHRPGTEWVVPEVARMQQEHGCAVVVDAGGPAGSLIPALVAADVTVTEAKTADYLEACARLYDAVIQRAVTHADYPELNAAVMSAQTRNVGERWAWARRLGDITMLEAVTLALWGAVNADTEVWGFWE